MIDLNSEKFSTVDRKPVFNDGKAGEVVCTVKIVKKNPEQPANYPDWELILVDPNNKAELSKGFYYLDPTHERYEKQLKFQGTALNHIIHSIYGKDVKVPPAATPKELLDNVMNMALQGVAGKQFKFAVTYGTKMIPNKRGFLGIKTFVPFMTANLEETLPISADFDLLERIVPDDMPTAQVTPGSITSDDGSSNKLPWEED